MSLALQLFLGGYTKKASPCDATMTQIRWAHPGHSSTYLPVIAMLIYGKLDLSVTNIYSKASIYLFILIFPSLFERDD